MAFEFGHVTFNFFFHDRPFQFTVHLFYRLTHPFMVLFRNKFTISKFLLIARLYIIYLAFFVVVLLTLVLILNFVSWKTFIVIVLWFLFPSYTILA